ncbi:MAG: LicD family protein [Paludibacteraceae bacterium]|nr:LicD family protein [Paludibacteraceae bacterium]
MNITQLIQQANIEVKELSSEDLKRLQNVLLDMFRDVYSACQKYGISILLSGGSCLGAVRHQGFIPWDDDLDTIMVRKDYEKLPQILQQEYGNKYRCVGANISNVPKFPFMKIQRTDCITQDIYHSENNIQYLSMDVFPIDNIPDNIIKRLWHGFWLNAIQYIALCIYFYKERNCCATQILQASKDGRKTINTRLFIGKIASLLFNESNLYIFFDRYASKYQHIETTHISIPTGREHYFGEIHTPSKIIPASYMKFADIMAPLPKDYDTYLRRLYGNYMEIPPLEKREKHYFVNIKFPEE